MLFAEGWAVRGRGAVMRRRLMLARAVSASHVDERPGDALWVWQYDATRGEGGFRAGRLAEGVSAWTRAQVVAWVLWADRRVRERMAEGPHVWG